MAQTVERLRIVQRGDMKLPRVTTRVVQQCGQHSDVFRTSAVKASLPDVYKIFLAHAFG